MPRLTPLSVVPNGISFPINDVNDFFRDIVLCDCVHHRQDLFEMMNVFRKRFHGGQQAIGGFQVHLKRSDGQSIISVDEQLSGGFIADVGFMGKLNDVGFCGMFSVIDFRPIDDAEDVIVGINLLPSELTQRLDKLLRRNTFIAKKPPSGLSGSERGDGFDGDRESGSRFLRMLKMSFHEEPVTVVEPLVGQIRFDWGCCILRTLPNNCVSSNSKIYK